MRGVAGLLFVFLGLVMGYMILSGKFLGSSPSVNPNPVGTPGNEVSTSSSSSSFLNNGTVHAPGHGPTGDGGNSLGLPTMSHLNDVAASHGGMQ